MNTFVEEWSARAAYAAGVVFDFGGVISVAPSGSWALYPFCAARGLDRAAVAAGWTKYRHLWDGGFITFDEMYRGARPRRPTSPRSGRLTRPPGSATCGPRRWTSCGA